MHLQGFFVNNISGYAKFFPVFFFKYNPKNLPFQAGFLTFLVIYHKTISLQPILAIFTRILYILNVFLEKVPVRHD